MNLFQSTRHQLDWLISFGRKIRKLTPVEATVGIVVFMFSQFFLVLAMFLPLKAILLLATQGIPWYLAGLMTTATRDFFVLGIALGAIVSYGLHHLCDRLVAKAVRRGSQRILEKTRKLHLFDNQMDFAHNGYLRLIRAIASGLLVLLVFALGLYLNPLLFALLIGVVVIEYSTLHYLLKSQTQFGRALDEVFVTRLGIACNVLSTSNFLIGFVLLFGQFMTAEQRNIIIAILSILLMRQAMQRISIVIQDLVFLARNRLRLNALFYTSIQYIPPTADQHQGAFLATLAVSDRNRWLASVLAQILERPVAGVDTHWIDSGLSGLATLNATVSFTEANGQSENYFIKYYHKKQARLAVHETQLFTAMQEGLPCAPRYHGTVTVDGHHVLVFQGLPGRQPSHKQWKQLALPALFRLWSVVPDAELVRAYLRTHPTITERLKPAMFAQMKLAAETVADETLVRQFIAAWPTLHHSVNQLPLVIRNPSLNLQSCRLDAQGMPCFVSWQHWSIEPIGCEAALANRNPADHNKVLSERTQNAIPSSENTIADLMLVARLFQLEVALKQHRFQQSLQISATILQLLREAGSRTSICKAIP